MSTDRRRVFQAAIKEVKQAFEQHRLTLLIDALDEAPERARTGIVERALLLFRDKGTAGEQGRKGNRMFLSSRPSERMEFLRKEIPVFHVLSLNMEAGEAAPREVEDWIAQFRREHLLQFDPPYYHPEDKNFNYFQGMVGPELTGFFGSPNLRHEGGVLGCIFSRDGRFMVSASSDKTLKLWDVQTGKEIRGFHGHEYGVNSCALSSDGSLLVSASDDKTLKLWNIHTGNLIKSLELPSFPNHVAFSPTSPETVFTANDNGTVTVFEFGKK